MNSDDRVKARVKPESAGNLVLPCTRGASKENNEPQGVAEGYVVTYNPNSNHFTETELLKEIELFGSEEHFSTANEQWVRKRVRAVPQWCCRRGQPCYRLMV